MKYPRLIFLLSFILTSCLSPSTDTHSPPATLTVATSANMQFVMERLVDVFSQENGINCQIIISSSGKLTAQIKEGAPFDIFVSANMDYPLELYKAGKSLGKPGVYAYGQLILWSRKNGLSPSFEKLTEPEVKHIAIANPKTAPYGEAAIEALKNYGIYESVKDKLVFGESISQVNQFILTVASEVGITAKSVVLSKKLFEEGKWIPIDPSLHSTIKQGVVMINRNDTLSEGARLFYKFLFSTEAKEILRNYGYLVDE